MSRRPAIAREAPGATGSLFARARADKSPMAHRVDVGSGHRSLLLICWFPIVMFLGRAAADEIRTATGARYAAVRIEDVQEGRLHFRDVQGRVLNRSVADVGALEITGWEAFNRAEKLLADKQHRLAAREYEAILRTVEQAGPDVGRPRHRRELVLARLLAACDGEGRFDRAVECYILLCQAWGSSAAGLEPRNIPPKESAFHVTATMRLSAAVAEAGSTPAAEPLRRFAARLRGEPDTRPASRPVAAPPKPRAAARASPRRDDSDPRLARVARQVEAGEYEQALAHVSAAVSTEPLETLGAWYYWRGRCLEGLARDDAGRMEAALAYIRVAVHFPADARCAECLYRTAMILKQAGRADRSAALLREALERSPDDVLRRKCEAELGTRPLRPVSD